MPARRIALATAAAAVDLDVEAPLLLDALRERGAVAELPVWDDEAVDWSGFDLVVVRSTWDYAPRRGQFLAWAQRADGLARVLNPPRVLEWNTDKHYLGDLEAAGVPVVPTTFVEPGAQAWSAPGGGDYVVKPAVSAGSKDTARYRACADDGAAGAHVGALHAAGRSVMVQPYLASVDDVGESALVHLGGELSHALRKGPLLTAGADPVAGLYAEEEMSERAPSAAEVDVAARVLAAASDVLGLAEPLLYARVDLLATDDGPVLLELELTEPSLFVDVVPAAAGRFADLVLARAGGAGQSSVLQ